MASGSGKQYGLVLPGKKFNINEVKRASVFNNESDSDDNGDVKEMGTSDWIKKSFQKQAALNVGVRKQTEIDMKRALEEDPTVYKYDEIYDEIEKKKLDEEKKRKDEKRKPRYIQSLLKKAELRKIENERRIERQVQKEREAEGEQFKDKETFVTSAYKKKLEEFHKLDEAEKKQDMLEDICDVSKQQDLGGFYRHLYRTTVDKDNPENKIDKKLEIKKEDSQKTGSVSASTQNVDKDCSKSDTDKKVQKEKRQYRKRKSSESSSLEEGERNSDSDTTISSSSSSDSGTSTDSKSSAKSKEKENDKPPEKDDNKTEQPTKAKRKKIEVEKCVSDEKVEDVKNDSSNKTVVKTENSKEISPPAEQKVVETKVEKPKINIWEKRTVGPIFEEALKRYFTRKAERQAARGN